MEGGTVVVDVTRLPSFAEPQDFSEKCLRRENVRYVDPPEFPMLHPVVPVTFAGLRMYRRELRRVKDSDGAIQDVSPHFMNECSLHAHLIESLRGVPVEEARARFVRHYSRAYSIPGDSVEEKYQTMVEYVSMAWNMIREFIERFVPELLRAPLTSDGRSDSMNDPVGLIMLCADSPVMSGDELNLIRAFKARRTLVLAQELMTLGLGAASIDRVNTVERTLTERLERDFFVKGLLNRVYVRAAIETGTGRCMAILAEGQDPPAGTRLRTVPFTVRYFMHGDKPIPVLFIPDKKTLSSLLLKMIVRSKREPQAMPDVNRFLMVLRNALELGVCLRRVHETVFPVGGTSHGFISNLHSQHAAVGSNAASSRDHLLVKVDHVVLADGFQHPIEGQYMRLVDWIQNATPAFDGSHVSYKSRQVHKARKLLFPMDVFHIDWDSPENLELLGIERG